MRFMFGRSRGEYRPLPRYENHDIPSDASSDASSDSRCSKSARRTKCIIGGTALLLGTVLAARYLVPCSESSGYVTDDAPPSDNVLTAQQLQALQTGNHSISAGGDRRLRVFMSADSPHINLCKSAMSAVALGYPAPTPLNWGGGFHPKEWHLARSHIAKLESLLSVIEDLLARAEGEDSDAHDHDLAVLVDAHDVWFQLPPSVLIQRYHQLNREADKRVRRRWEDAQGFATDFPIQAPKQSIIVTAAKDCHCTTDSGSDPHDSHWPDSTMPSDMCGRGTDKVSSTPSYPAREFDKIRPRCVNNAMVIGTMASLRDALVREKAKAETIAHRGTQLWRNQPLFGEVIGDQETWREWVRKLGSTWNGTTSENLLSKLPRDVREIAKASMHGERFEYGIGLEDSFGTISPTCSAEDRGDFVRINDVQAVQEASVKAGVPYEEVRIRGVPGELLQKTVGPKHLEAVEWGNVPLYSDFYLGVTPVVIHHDAYPDGPKKKTRLVDWWSKMWFHAQLRNLVAHAMLPISARSIIRPLARLTLQAQTGEREIRYWAPKSHVHNRMVKIFQPSPIDATSGGSYIPMAWEGICQSGTKTPWHQEIFGDAKGPWQM
ncbi:hypothetical protein EsDP_00001569 [Epichloe bromicola]|uniref:Glycosyltransferase family 25 protein n=1 Tax=Epichloe bromicola TaxID=79588 RepID=A0ABQ0CI83_9HYPO